MKPYDTNPLAELTDAQLDEIMGYNHPFTVINQQNILTRFDRERKVHPCIKISKRFVVVLVAVLAVILVGFTNADRIQQLYYKYFGNARIEQYAHEIGQSSSDQGFRVDVLTAISDGENTYLFVDLVDETSDRLGEDLYVDYCSMDAISKKLGDNVASMYGISCRLIEYNPDIKTATLAVHAQGNFEGNITKFTLGAFGTDKIDVKDTILSADLYDLAKNNQAHFQPLDNNVLGSISMGGGRAFVDGLKKFSDITDCLAMDTLEIRFPCYDLDYVSGIGYRNGYLHVQINEAYNGKGKSMHYVLQNSKTGQELESFYTLAYGLDHTQSASAPFVTDYPDCHTEFVYEIGNLENIKDYVFRIGEGEYYKNVFHGKWEVCFDAPEQATSVEIPAGKTVGINGKEMFIKTITATPLGVTFVTKTATESTDGNYKVTVLFSDGKQYELNSETQMYVHENGEQEWQHIGAIMDFDKLTAVEINGIIFEVVKTN